MSSIPTFMGMETAKSAIFVNQASLNITGNNLSNVNTVGYTRQSVERSATVVHSYANRVGGNRPGILGQGVTSLGVSQTRDALLDARFREENSSTAYHDQFSTVLSEIELALGDATDITDSGSFYGAIEGLYASLNSFIQEPTSSTQANIVMASFQNLTQVLNQMDSNLTNLANDYALELDLDTARVNEIAAEIAHLNTIISCDHTNGGVDTEYFGPNELFDQRNVLLDELSTYGNISVTTHADNQIDVSFGDHNIVSKDFAETLQLTTDSHGISYISFVSSGDNLSTTSGSLLATTHVLNGHGINATVNGQEPYQGIPYYRNQLDVLAAGIAEIANNTIPVVDADGNIVDGEFRTLIGAKTEAGQTTTKLGIDASNITISTDWVNAGSSYFVFDENEYVEDYAQELASKLLNQDFNFVSDGESFTGTFTEYYINIIGKLGTDITYHDNRADAFALVANSYLTERESVSGVSSDEETANLLKYQKSYEAAARLMTTFDEMLNVVINNMGLVGR